jgi:hypothetical protein
VTSRLGTGKSLTFFYSASLMLGSVRRVDNVSVCLFWEKDFVRIGYVRKENGGVEYAGGQCVKGECVRGKYVRGKYLRGQCVRGE